jgi:hypothetical protein
MQIKKGAFSRPLTPPNLPLSKGRQGGVIRNGCCPYFSLFIMDVPIFSIFPFFMTPYSFCVIMKHEMHREFKQCGILYLDYSDITLISRVGFSPDIFIQIYANIKKEKTNMALIVGAFKSTYESP